MRKILQLEDRFPTGEPTLVPVGRWQAHRWHVEKVAFDKAAASPAYDYLKAYAPRAGHTIVLVNALGAYEAYDENRNGDGFSEFPYKVGYATPCGHAECNPNGGKQGWVSEPEALLHHYQSFEEHGGVFQHHANKDPSKSMGKVLKAIWNPRMHRVELLLDLQNDKNPELIKRIDDGEYPAVSMGCHVKWDVCTRCGHRAPTRAQYCEHARFAMRAIDKRTGEKNAVLNPSPRFFDISIVYRPADPTGWMMKKVAEAPAVYELSALLGERLDARDAKQAEARKLSDIQKVVSGQVSAVKGLESLQKVQPFLRDVVREGPPPLGPKEVRAMLAYTLPEVLSTCAAYGQPLAVGELGRFLFAKAGAWVGERELDRVVAVQPALLDLFAAYPEAAEKLSALVEIAPHLVRPKLADELGGWLRQQAFDVGGPLAHSPWGSHYQANEAPKTDLMTMTDPNTGHVYTTTRGAAMAANHEKQTQTLRDTALLSGLGTLALGKLPGVRRLPWQARAALSVYPAYHGAKGLEGLFDRNRNPTYVTDQGIEVPGGTEFVKSSTLLAKLARDYAERGVATHGQLTAKLAGAFWRASPAAQAAWLTEGCEKLAYTSVEPPDLDLDRVLTRLGAALKE